MRQIILTSHILLLAFISSCSWHSDSSFNNTNHELEQKMMKDLNLKAKEIKRFKVKAATPAKKTKRKALLKKNSKLEITTEIDFPEIIPYPENYPEQLISFDGKAYNVWPKFSPSFSPKETANYSVKFFGVTVGKLSVKVMPSVLIDDKDAYHFQATFQSAPFYRYIYEINDVIDTYVEKQFFAPIKYVLRQRESRQTIDDLQLFDTDNFKTFLHYRRIRKDQTKVRKEESLLPKHFQDSFSALYFIRGLPLKIGDTYQFPVATRAKVWLIKIHVDSIETIWTNIGKQRAVKIIAETQYQYPGNIKKKGQLSFWFTDNKTHHLLKFKGDIKIGSIIGEIDSLTSAPNKQPNKQ